MTSLRMLVPRGTKSDSCGAQWVYKYEYVGMVMSATMFMLVGRHIINSSMRRGNKCIIGEHRYHMSRRTFFYPVHKPSDILVTFPSPSNV